MVAWDGGVLSQGGDKVKWRCSGGMRGSVAVVGGGEEERKRCCAVRMRVVGESDGVWRVCVKVKGDGVVPWR